MIQFAALLGTVLDGLSDRDHPDGTCVYAVRDDNTFIYIGMTGEGPWERMRAHKSSYDRLWMAVRDAGPQAAHWRVEVCHFLTEQRIDVLERELIRRYAPVINRRRNRGRRPIDITPSVSAGAHPSPAFQAIFALGWPSFTRIELETLPRCRLVVPNSPINMDGAVPADTVALHQYQLLTPCEQEAVLFWIAHAFVPATKLHRTHSSKGMCKLFHYLGFPIDLDAFRGAMLVAAYTPVWSSPTARDCAYQLRQAMRRGQSDSKWGHHSRLGYVPAFAYAWYWSTDALQEYSVLLEKLGPLTQRAREEIQRLLAAKYGQSVEGQWWY